MHISSAREKFKNWGEKTTLHAVPIVFESRHMIVRLIAVIAVLASTGYCAYTLIINLQDYLAYSTDTVVTVTRDDVTYFPTVSVCYSQLCGLTDYSYKPYYSMALNQTIDKANRSFADVYDQTLVNFVNNYNKSTLLSLTNNNIDPSIKANLSIENILISCLYNNTACSKDDFVFFQISEFQQCYKFNSGKNRYGQSVPLRTSNRFTPSYGLRLELFNNLPDNCKSPLNKIYGMFIYVHNNTVSPSEESSGIQLAVGSETNIAIDRTFDKQLPKPYSECVDNDSPAEYTGKGNQYVDYTFKVATNYSQIVCQQVCYQKYVQNTYKCTDQFLPYLSADLSTYPYCDLIINSYNNSKYYDKIQFYNESMDNKCLDQCPSECEYFTYKATVSQYVFPTETYDDALKYKSNFISYTGGDLKKVRNSTIHVNVYFNTDLFTYIKNKPSLDFDTWVANSGGTLGLFLGASLLSFVEFIDLAIESLIIMLCVKKRVNNTNTFK